MGDRTEVIIDRPASDAEVQAVQDAFEGLAADVTSAMERRGVGDFPWVVFVTVAAGTPAVAFFKKIGELAAQDAWAALKGWVGGVGAARRQFRSTDGKIVIDDGRGQAAEPSRSGRPARADVQDRCEGTCQVSLG